MGAGAGEAEAEAGSGGEGASEEPGGGGRPRESVLLRLSTLRGRMLEDHGRCCRAIAWSVMLSTCAAPASWAWRVSACLYPRTHVSVVSARLSCGVPSFGAAPKERHTLFRRIVNRNRNSARVGATIRTQQHRHHARRPHSSCLPGGCTTPHRRRTAPERTHPAPSCSLRAAAPPCIAETAAATKSLLGSRLRSSAKAA